MRAAGAIFIGLAAFAGVAYAATRPRVVASRGDGVDQPDAPSLWQQIGGGDWGPAPVFDAVVDEVMGTVMDATNSNANALSATGLDQLKKEEGFASLPYWDHKGYSIGYGHLIKPGEAYESISEQDAESLLLQDVEWAEEAVRTAVHVPLNANQFDALVLLTYNIGAGAFKGSTLVRKLNAGDYAGAAEEFLRWNRASGSVNAALVARRDRERTRFLA